MEPTSSADELIDIHFDIRIAIAHLEPLDRQLVIMRFVEEYTWSEIAELTGLTVAQVCHRVDNALAKLRRWLGASEEEKTED